MLLPFSNKCSHSAMSYIQIWQPHKKCKHKKFWIKIKVSKCVLDFQFHFRDEADSFDDILKIVLFIYFFSSFQILVFRFMLLLIMQIFARHISHVCWKIKNLEQIFFSFLGGNKSDTWVLEQSVAFASHYYCQIKEKKKRKISLWSKFNGVVDISPQYQKQTFFILLLFFLSKIYSITGR